MNIVNFFVRNRHAVNCDLYIPNVSVKTICALYQSHVSNITT